MDQAILLLSATAITLGFLHTLLGPDHYLPFIVLSQAKGWSVKKTMVITFLCGVGHVLSSVILGIIGIGVGISVNKLVSVESFRGSIAGWLFIAFGLVYMVISIRNLVKKHRHTHNHFHFGGQKHEHEHDHKEQHTHIHERDEVSTTPWILFLIFVFGPCEPLIPILMYPAAENNISGMIIVSVLFSVVTIGTMMSIVLAFKMGLSRINLKPIEKYNHLIAGSLIFLSGIAIQYLGL
jgi:nickel/cobalt transporter (NicO) family protein